MNRKFAINLIVIIAGVSLLVGSVLQKEFSGFIFGLVIVAGGMTMKKLTAKKMGIDWRNHKVSALEPKPLVIKSKRHDLTAYEKTAFKISDLPIMGLILGLFEKNIKNTIPFTGKPVDEVKLSARVALPFFIATLFLTGLGVTLGLVVSIKFLTLLAAPFFLPILPKLVYGMSVSSRKSNVEGNLPFFLPFVEILHILDFTISKALQMINKQKIFPGIEIDSKLFLKYKKLGVEEIAAILEIADKQPNEKFRKFLYSYASILKTDVSLLHSHLSAAVTDAYLSLEHSVESKRNTLTPLFMMASSAAFVGPMFVVLMLKFPNVPASLLLFGINLMPFLTMIMIFSVGGIRIFSEDIVKFSKRSLIAGIPSFVAVYLVNHDPLVSSGAALTCIAAWNWIGTRKQDSSINVMESEIPTALRIITKKTEIGLDLFSSLKEIASEKIFSKSFRQVFSNILFDLNSGVPVVNAIYRKNTPSYVMRMTLFVIYAFFESGATNSIALDKFTTMMEKITRAKKQFQSGMILNSIAMLLSPISILFTFLLTMSLFNIDLSAVTNSLPGFQGLVMTDNKAVASGLKPAVLFFGICAGLTVSSSAFFSIKRTLPLAIATGISTVTLVLWDYVVANVKITGVF